MAPGAKPVNYQLYSDVSVYKCVQHCFLNICTIFQQYCNNNDNHNNFVHDNPSPTVFSRVHLNSAHVKFSEKRKATSINVNEVK